MRTLKYISYVVVLISLLSAYIVQTPEQPARNKKTIIFAHRAAAGLWPQNSRHAVIQSLEAMSNGSLKGHGIEIDLVLTQDQVPVLAHDPWISKDLCTHSDGSAIKKILIKDIRFKELTENYRCGAIQNKKFPTAKTISESILGFDDFLVLLKDYPQIHIYLDIKIQDGLTASNNEYAKAIFSRWESSGLTNTLYVEGPTTESIAAYYTHATEPFISILSYPPFYANENWTKVGVLTLLKTAWNSNRALEHALTAKADAIASPFQVMTLKAQQKLQNIDRQVILFTLNDKQLIENACKSGVDIIITDYPNLGSCSDT